MYKTNVIINLSVEGIHAWPGIPESLNEVGFLKYPHRHTFTIKAKKSVTHDDRDLEIILLKRDVTNFLKKEYFSTCAQCLMFGAMSCEMIAKQLVQMFGFEYCEVLEDGENGAEVVREMPNFGRVTAVYGWPCSGKDTFIKAHLGDYNQIVVSDIVREVSKETSTQELAQTGDLHAKIVEKLLLKLDTYRRNDEKVVINGIRQVEIFDALRAEVNSNIWLDVPYQEREARYIMRDRESDDLSYDEIVDLNKDLGLADLERKMEVYHLNTYRIEN